MNRLSLLLAVFLLSVSGARTQPPIPPRVVEADKGGNLIIALGSTQELALPAGAPFTEILVSNEEIVQVRAGPRLTHLVITGKAIGTATLNVMIKDKPPLKYTIVVESPRLHVARRVGAGYIAFSVGLSAENAVAGHLGMNDYVVVFVTTKSDLEKKTVVLMKNIRIVASPEAMIGPPLGATPSAPRGTVILEVTIDEAKQLKSAQEAGTLALGVIAEADLKDEKKLQDRKGDAGSPNK